MTIDQLLTIAGFALAAVAFIVGLCQYRTAQAWKRAEWVAGEVDRFLADRRVANALTMIDWSKRRIELFPGREDESQRMVLVTAKAVEEALVPHEQTEGFTPEQAAIRDCFDRMLDGLERFEAFVEAELITVEDLDPYLDYWIERIAMRHADAQGVGRLKVLGEFIERYDYDGVTKLLDRFGELEARRERDAERRRQVGRP